MNFPIIWTMQLGCWILGWWDYACAFFCAAQSTSGITGAGEHTAINLGPDPPDALQELSAQRRYPEIRSITLSCEVKIPQRSYDYVFPKKKHEMQFWCEMWTQLQGFWDIARRVGTQDTHMDQLRTIFHHAIFGTGHHSLPPTAGFIEFLQIMSGSVGLWEHGVQPIHIRYTQTIKHTEILYIYIILYIYAFTCL